MTRGDGKEKSRDGGPIKRGKVHERFTGGYLPPPHIYKTLCNNGPSDGLVRGIGQTVKKVKCDTVFTPVNKDYYTPAQETASRPMRKVEAYRQKHKMKISENYVQNPIITFEEANLPGFLMEVFQNNGYKAPTPIQAQGWPIALSGRDFVGVARTGAGKTLAYLLPAFIHIKHQPRLEPGEGPIVLCLAPTRDVAKQIHGVAAQFGECFGVRSACLFSGVPMKRQLLLLSSPIDLLVATPCRLFELFNIRGTNFRRTTYLVIDGADRMLDLDFATPIRKIVCEMRRDRQTLVLAATWPEEVRKFAEPFLRDYVQVDVGFLKQSGNRDIQHVVEVCDESEKDDKLFELLETIPQNLEDRTIIFCKEANVAADLKRRIKRNGYTATASHEDMVQRNVGLKHFRSGAAKILIATDATARGLNVEGVNFVIHFDFPSSTKDYVHRIGRIGQWNRTGTAYTFFTENNADQAKDLIAVLTKAKQVVSPELRELESRYSAGGFEAVASAKASDSRSDV